MSTDRRAGPAAEQGVGDVPAVQLADRQQVEGGHQKPDPAGPADRVEDELRTLRDRAEKETAQELEEKRLPEEEDILRRDERGPFGQRHADSQSRQGQRESGERAVGADIEDLPLEVQGRLDADESPEGPQERRSGDEEGQGGPDAVAAAGQVVAELMADEDGHQEGRIEGAQGEEPGVVKHPAGRDEQVRPRGVAGLDEARAPGEPGITDREDGQDEQQPVQPGLLFGRRFVHGRPKKKRSETGSLLFR